MQKVTDEVMSADAPITLTATPTRRHVLLGLGAVAGAAMLVGCGGSDSGSKAAGGDQSSAVGSATAPLPTPATFNESPLLTAQVDAGKLPKITERIPAKPYVVPHKWLSRGTYGGALRMNVPSNTDYSNAEWFYGYSMLRYLNDGRDLGPGLVEKWESNADSSVWTFTLRSGLKWSDGSPATTKDILFWWKDLVLNPDFPMDVPEECKSGKGTVAKLTATDDQTFVIAFDAPSPLTAERIAMWVNGFGCAGPSWILPSEYCKQFHATYTKGLPKDWATVLFPARCTYRLYPACPTLSGFRLAKYSEGRSLLWERNPYYYAVTPDGDQLPYIDRMVMTVVADPQVGKLQIIAGRVDISHGAFNQVDLSDVSTLMKSKEKGNYDVLLWDSGSGTGSILFFCQDYEDPKYRKLIKEAKFRQALSLAFNRGEALSAIYFKRGEITTGTASPKAIEYLATDDGKTIYKQWRDSFAAYDVEKAKAMLDDLGLIDTDGDGFREFPDKSKLTIRIDLQADAGSEHKQKDQQLVRDWKAVGINTRINPVPPVGFDDQWKLGKYMAHSNWEASDGPNHLLNPAWLIPLEFSRWAPLQGAMYNAKGTPAYTSEADVDPYKRHPPRVMPDKGGPIEKLWDLYDQSKVEPDAVKRQALVFEIIKVHMKDGPFFQGTVANSPRVVVAHNDLRNIPRRENLALNGYVNTWIHPVPAAYDPEAFYWRNPEEHSA
jgi:peptide/nickel transport system substrate-binding protein